MKRCIYGVMVRFPEPGKVKTRLGRDIGDDRAAAVYRAVTETVVRNTRPELNEYRRVVFYDPPERVIEFSRWLPGERLLPQSGGDIGTRMDSAIGDMFLMGAEQVVLTGSDIPNLDTGIIRLAFRGLDEADVVIGPAKDGGYYLIGMKQRMPELFRGITWSTATVFDETVAVIRGLAASCTVLPVLSDLDTEEDLAASGG